jgi:ABC-type Fe3+-siderophore transport system permease subunit
MSTSTDHAVERTGFDDDGLVVTDTRTTRALGRCLLGAAVVLAIACCLSLMAAGTHTYSVVQVWDALIGHADPLTEAAIRSLRLPRTIIGVLVGASLGVAGGLIQGVTRNPIVEPSIIGINSGAALAVAIVTYTLGAGAFVIGGVNLMPFAAFVGATCAAGLVYALVSGIDTTPGRIALAGVTVAMLANAMVMSVVILNDDAVRFLLRFLVGGIDGTTWTTVRTLAPYTVIGLLAALAIAQSVTILSLGDDVARGLGLRVTRIRLGTLAVVVILAGSSVAVAGPIAMVGLLVPHTARWLVGLDYRRVVALSAVLGAALLVAADVVSRFVVPGIETPVGVLTAVIGTPYFIFLARRGRGIV